MPCTVYPVGVTTYWCDFSQIIAKNIASVYRIPTKLGNNMCPSVYQISSQSDNPFPPCGKFHTLTGKKK